MNRRIFILTLLAMTAFAANSLLCRMALKSNAVDAASFTLIRLLSGALMLGLIVKLRGNTLTGNWYSALSLFAYASCFSFAYLSLPTATGALLLFGAVQTTMFTYGFYRGERLRRRQLLGVIFALSGLIGLLLPGLTMPPLQGAILMLVAGVAWGAYSIRGKSCGDATSATAGNFMRAAVLALGLSLFNGLPQASFHGVSYAIVSGALASGLGYAIWYTVLRDLSASKAAIVQLSVPILAALGGIIFLHEILTIRLILAGSFILLGIAIVTIERK